MSSATLVADSQRPAAGEPDPEIPCVVIAWSDAEPSRVGEIAVLGPPGTTSVLGRGTGDDPREPRTRFFRQRPGTLEPTEPLLSPGISRRQLAITATEDGARIERIGQCVVEVNGQRVDLATLRHGDVVHLRGEMVLYCGNRAALIPPSRLFPRSAAKDFGEPDSLGIIGESPLAWSLRESVAFAAKADVHVLVLGESGTGKELAARATHALSARSGRTFIARNAATLPPGLVDAELFGNAKNYPNPGMAERAGLIGEADGGTLFLDEIGELPAELQAHLLRALDTDGEYQRLGDANVRRSSFRLVAATNRDPGHLKHDFLARFTAHIELPSLEDRREDIPLLARHLLARAAKRSPEVAARFRALDPRLIVHCMRRSYVANIRELDALLWKAMAESHGDVLELPASLRDKEGGASPPADSEPLSEVTEERPEPNEDDIRAALVQSQWSVPKAAAALGVSSRYALYRLMKKHGITDPSGNRGTA